MKSIIKYFAIYVIGLFFVFTVIWRYDSLNKANQASLNSSNYNSTVISKK